MLEVAVFLYRINPTRFNLHIYDVVQKLEVFMPMISFDNISSAQSVY